MTRFFRRLTGSRWLRSFLGVAVLAALVWFCGPLLGIGQLHPLETEIVRWLVIAALFTLWLVTNLLQEIRFARKERQLADSVVTVPDESAVASAEEVALLSERLRTAIRTLKQARRADGSRQLLAALPWYMFIGPPGSGKSTALLNCGLRFPLADARGSVEALHGVGGTRNCDWWFTDEAVLIDTAGRYTTQDSHAAVDNAAWIGFLQLLKKYRRRRPLNGVLVTISLSDLSVLNEAERSAHAHAIRRRVRELHDELGVRIPVYVLFTKADLIAGFVEFFDNMGREEREQVWGVTFPLDDGRNEAGTAAAFPAAFDSLINRLNERSLERMHQETDLQRRRLIYGFPQQFSSLRDVAAEFLAECFRPSRLEARALLRGAYFTSGTQDGTPIDRLLGTMTAEFGLQRQAVASFSGSGRSYFLARLVREVIFGEAGLVGLDPREERRNRWVYRAGVAGCAVALLVLGGSWFASYLGNRDLIGTVHASAAIYNAQIAALAKRGPLDTDLAVVVPALDTLRAVHGGYDERDAPAPVGLTFGLYQGDKLGAAANEAYMRALNGMLLPRMLARLETEIQQRMNNPDFLYQALKVYLVLGRRGPLDRDLVMQWFNAELLGNYPADESAPLRDALARHADAMLRQPLTPVALSEGLITQVRLVLNKEPLAEYSYNRIMRSKRVTSLPPWTIADNGGPGCSRVFQLHSGKSLDSGVPGVYTWLGYHNVFLPILTTVTQDITEDAWVLGRPTRDLAATVRDTAKLRAAVLGLYLDDYVRRWDAMLADVGIKPFDSLQQGLDELSLLSAPASPLRDMLLSVDTQTQLSRSGAIEQALSQAGDKAAKFGQRAAGLAGSGLAVPSNEVASIFGEATGTDPSGKPVDPATRVDAHFKPLHDFVTGADGRPSALEGALGKIQLTYQNLNLLANAPNQGQALLGQVSGAGSSNGGGTSAAAQLQDQMHTMPKPVAVMLQSIPAAITQVTTNGASHELADAWRSKVLPLCDAAFNRYPMVASSPVDVPPDDFARLLAPGGVMDQFFDQYIKGFVDTTQRPWKWLSNDQLGLSAGSLTEFERAAQIRDALFSNGNQLQVHFQLLPVALDPRVAQITVDIGGQTLVWSHGPPEYVQFQWPGPEGKTLVRVTMTPASVAGGQGQVSSFDGSWALLHMLDAAQVTPSGQPDRFRISFRGAGGSATFDLIASSVNNPFTLSALRTFHCPPKL